MLAKDRVTVWSFCALRLSFFLLNATNAAATTTVPHRPPSIPYPCLLTFRSLSEPQSRCCVARYHKDYIDYIVLYAGFLMVVREAGCGALNTQTVFPSHGTHLVAVGRPSTPQICGGSQGCHVSNGFCGHAAGRAKSPKAWPGTVGTRRFTVQTLPAMAMTPKPPVSELWSTPNAFSRAETQVAPFGSFKKRAFCEGTPRNPKKLTVRGYPLLTTVRRCGASRRLRVCLCSCPARLYPSRPSDP